jgi:hypothetical protein
MTEELWYKLYYPLYVTACPTSTKLGESAGDAFTNPADNILLYKAEETIAAFESLGTPKNLIFRAKTGIMRLVMSMKPAKAAHYIDDKRADRSGNDTHRS